MELIGLAEAAGRALQASGLMLATAESCTGGGVAQAITEIPGSSLWFERGFVTYSNRAKEEMLGVGSSTLSQFGAVSEETVAEMVRGALARSHAQVALAISGIAGPDGGTLQKPVGTVCFAWGLAGQPVVTRRLRLSGDRHEVRQQAVICAIEGLVELLQHE